MMKRWIAFVLLLALLLPASAFAADSVTYTAVTQDTLNLRKSASPTGTVLDKVKQGKQVTVLSNDGTWCKVKFGSRTGYLMASHLTMQGGYGHIGWGKTAQNGGILNLLEKPEEGAGVAYKALSGGALELVSESGEWYYAKCGDAFGYLKKSEVSALDGDFTLCYTGKDQDALTLNTLRLSPREFGDEVTREGEEGALAFRFTYPDLHIDAADEKISAWFSQIRKTCAEDLAAHHAGVSGSLTVEYQAQKFGSRYESAVLMAEYRAGDFAVPFFLTLNIDGKEGRLIEQKELLGADLDWICFCLESGLSAWLLTPAEGYTGKPDASWLENAAIGRSGLEVYLPAGVYLPSALGSRKVDIPYGQIADCLGLDDVFLGPYKRVIDPTQPMIALTFDDGPSEQTDKILKVLAQYNARATFCVVGNRTESFAAVLKRTVAGGNEIASHTWDHKKLTTLSVKTITSQLQRTNDAVKAIAGFDIKTLRPPYGSVNKNVRTVCKNLDMFVITWNIDTLDWKNRSTSKTYRAIVKNAKNGNVILMHDLYSTTAAAVEQAIPELIEKGVQLVTVSELLSFHQDGITPGTVYTNLDTKKMKTE